MAGVWVSCSAAGGSSQIYVCTSVGWEWRTCSGDWCFVTYLFSSIEAWALVGVLRCLGVFLHAGPLGPDALHGFLSFSNATTPKVALGVLHCGMTMDSWQSTCRGGWECNKVARSGQTGEAFFSPLLPCWTLDVFAERWHRLNEFTWQDWDFCKHFGADLSGLIVAGIEFLWLGISICSFALPMNSFSLCTLPYTIALVVHI